MKTTLLQIYWAITRIYLRMRGAEVGRNVRCNGFPYVKIRRGGRLLIEDDVNINATRWSNAHIVEGSTNFYVGPNATLRLGRASGISGSRIVALADIHVGAETLIGAGCLICDSDMHEVPLKSSNPVRSIPIRIGERVFIGSSTIVLKGVQIDNGTVVAAGTVVTKSIGANMLVGGNPARTIRPL